MILTDFIKLVNYNLRGTDDDPPAAGDADWKYWATLANTKKTTMYRDIKRRWSSSWDDDHAAGTIIVAAKPTFNLDESLVAASDKLLITMTDGREIGRASCRERVSSPV